MVGPCVGERSCSQNTEGGRVSMIDKPVCSNTLDDMLARLCANRQQRFST